MAKTTIEANTQTYYRYQLDKQPVIRRTAEQQKLVDEFFIIPNKMHTQSHIWLLCAGIALIVLSVALAIFLGIQSKKLLYSALCLILTVCGVVMVILYKKTIKVIDEPDIVMTSQEYETAVQEKTSQMEIAQKSLAILGVSAETMEGSTSVVFSDIVQNEESLYVYNAENKTLYSSTQQVTYLYFMSDRLLAYKVEFDMCCDTVKECASEIFYKDICDVTCHTESGVQTVNNTKIQHKSKVFCVATANTKFSFGVGNSIDNVASTESLRLVLATKRMA